MRLKTYYLGMAMILLLLSACAAESEPEPVPAPQPETEAAEPATGDDMLSGTWTGDWGPSATDRNAVVVELAWDGTTLSGSVIPPGQDAIELTNAAFDPATNIVRLEADLESFRGPLHYMIEGTLEGNMISGTWGHDDVSGDFMIMMGDAG